MSRMIRDFAVGPRRVSRMIRETGVDLGGLGEAAGGEEGGGAGQELAGQGDGFGNGDGLADVAGEGGGWSGRGDRREAEWGRAGSGWWWGRGRGGPAGRGGLAGDGGEGGGVEEQAVAPVGWADGVAEGADVGVDGAAVAAASAAGAELGHGGGQEGASVVVGAAPLVGQVEEGGGYLALRAGREPGRADGGHVGRGRTRRGGRNGAASGRMGSPRVRGQHPPGWGAGPAAGNCAAGARASQPTS